MVVITMAHELDEQNTEAGEPQPVGEAVDEVQLHRGDSSDDEQDAAAIETAQGQRHGVGGIEPEHDHRGAEAAAG